VFSPALALSQAACFPAAAIMDITGAGIDTNIESIELHDTTSRMFYSKFLRRAKRANNLCFVAGSVSFGLELGGSFE
jgi:hypothetical protein